MPSDQVSCFPEAGFRVLVLRLFPRKSSRLSCTGFYFTSPVKASSRTAGLGFESKPGASRRQKPPTPKPALSTIETLNPKDGPEQTKAEPDEPGGSPGSCQKWRFGSAAEGDVPCSSSIQVFRV